MESIAESFETEKLSWGPLALKLAVLIITVHHHHLPKMFKLWELDVGELGVLTNLGGQPLLSASLSIFFFFPYLALNPNFGSTKAFQCLRPI